MKDYTKIGLATRTCGEGGWTGEGNISICALKYTIPIGKADEYFDETEISDQNVEEYTDTISQVGQVLKNKVSF